MSDPKSFIDAYNAVLDQLSAENPTRLFWATDFASKNRFSCPLPDVLEQLEVQQAPPGPDSIPNVRLKRLAGVFYHAGALLWRMAKARRVLKTIDPNRRYTTAGIQSLRHSFTTIHLLPTENIRTYSWVLWLKKRKRPKTFSFMPMCWEIIGFA
jgi:hypothetical protein